MATALFVCLHNAGRSQMSAALFERAAHGRHVALSAGTTLGERVHPEVVEVMGEPGFDMDLSDRIPQRLTDELAQHADVVVTMGCGDQCPYIPGKRYIDWALTDPKGLPVDEVRRIRDEIAGRVQELVEELDRAAGDDGDLRPPRSRSATVVPRRPLAGSPDAGDAAQVNHPSRLPATASECCPSGGEA